MTLKEIGSLGRLLGSFLRRFADCFARQAGCALMHVYVQGLLSNIPRKNVEAIAMEHDIAPRTLQRFLESIKWDEQRVRDRCQEIVAREHAASDAIGCIDETGVAKSGSHTVGVQRQYNGNRGKVENSVVHVALGYASPGFHTLLDAQLYLPKSWADNPVLRKKTTCPTRCGFKPSSKSRWTSFSGPSNTASASRHGRSMNSTVATAVSSTGSTSAAKPSSGRFPPTAASGLIRHASCEIRRLAVVKLRNAIRDCRPDADRPRCSIYGGTRPPFTTNVPSVTASKTPATVPTFGKSSGTPAGGEPTASD